MTDSLTAREPNPALDRLLADLVPPPRFSGARLDNYVPDAHYPSQAEAKQKIGDFAGRVGRKNGGAGLLGKLTRKKPLAARGIYLDGGFGVGKTHLLASLFHVTTGHRVYGTFVEYTNLVGALGFTKAVDLFADSSLVCIDEFELDDPGDTLLMTRLIRELSDRGVSIVATSNTLPEALGEGRFAAQDFLREIQSMSERFEVLRIDGEDYRRRDAVESAPTLDTDEVRSHAQSTPGATLDAFDDVLKHLAGVHPSRYGAMIDGISVVHLTDLATIANHHDGLRFVVLVDRLYDREIPVLASGQDVTEIFTDELLRSGYRKKYYRSLSRLSSLVHDGAAQLVA